MDGEGGGEEHGDWEQDGGTVMEWLEIAGPLIEQFRETKALFPTDRVSRCLLSSVLS